MSMPQPQTQRICYLTWKRDFADMIKVKDLEMGHLIWNTQVVTIQSHESLKVATLSWLQKTKEMAERKRKI